ncbi:gamma-tubulin complex component 5-like [Asterias rubens]|uniref:gamma-tubulin complex component 5-like n=1 Tax=Asterias rubens TaxID=7604 RepID=UPI001455D813|nr:gamma-tubulin complex component 5-like [Asterias rubens]
MAQTSSLVEEEAKKLIENLTGFTDPSENFQRSFHFALSNFKFHRYLDVDSHKITKKIKGLKQKFEIHSHLDKAESFQKLTDKFLQLPLSEKNNVAKTDAHYSVLSVLCHLSDCPVNADYTETQRVPKQKAGDDFDWGKYLQEGLAPVPNFHDSSSDEWSDEEVLDDSAIQADQSETSPVSSRRLIGHDATGRPISSRGFGEGHCGRSWLERNVVAQYWNGDVDQTIQGSHNATRTASTWRCYEDQCSPYPSTEGKYNLTETHVIRETIWVLMGAEKSFLYQTQGDKFTARTDVQVSHLTPVALHSLTSGLAEICSHVLRLQGFIDTVRAAPMRYIPKASTDDGETRCQTYESLAEALTVILWELRKELTVLEKEIVKQETSMTLSKFASTLDPWTAKLSLLSRVHQTAIGPCQAWSSCVERTWLLLCTLYDVIEREYEQGMTAEQNVLLLLQVWLVTVRPYINFLDRWLSGSPLYDPAQEFVIKRNPEITVKSTDFWQKAFSLHVFINPSNQHGTTQQSHSSVHKSGANQHQQGGGMQGSRGEGVAVPVFLQPVLKEILLAGKCMELLESMGKLPVILNKYHPEKSSIYNDFSSSISTLLHERTLHNAKENKTPTNAKDKVLSSANSKLTAVDKPTITSLLNQLENHGIRDPFMAKNFQDWFSDLEYFGSKPDDAELASWSSLPDFSSAITSQIKPLQLLLHRCLYPLLLAKCNVICRELVNTLRRDYHLMETFASMRKFYLCEAGDTMVDFLSDLFDKLKHGHHDRHWQESLQLNYQLQTAVGPRFPNDADRLTVSFEPASAPSTVAIQPIHALDGLTLYYKVPWPLDIIIDEDAILVYNQVFRFLLQVKRAKYSLDQLSFTSLSHSASQAESSESKPPLRGTQAPSLSPKSQVLSKDQLLHRAYLFRFKLVHFVNAVHSYLMSRILHSTGLEFQSEIDQANDLEEIIEIHANYLNTISERCLLHKKVGLVREAVTKVLNLALVFQRRWDTGLNAFSAESIDKMLREFSNCSTFLLTMLNNINKRGAFPHLEALALSLTQSQDEAKGVKETRQR